jgi:hypothetical protein
VIAQVLSISLTLEDELNPYGRLKSASLKIKGMMIYLHPKQDKRDQKSLDHSEKYQFQFKGEERWREQDMWPAGNIFS